MTPRGTDSLSVRSMPPRFADPGCRPASVILRRLPIPTTCMTISSSGSTTTVVDHDHHPHRDHGRHRAAGRRLRGRGPGGADRSEVSRPTCSPSWSRPARWRGSIAQRTVRVLSTDRVRGRLERKYPPVAGKPRGGETTTKRQRGEPMRDHRQRQHSKLRLTGQAPSAYSESTLETIGGHRPSPVSAGFFVPVRPILWPGGQQEIQDRASGNTCGGSNGPRVTPGFPTGKSAIHSKPLEVTP